MRTTAHVYHENGKDRLSGISPDAADKWLCTSKQQPHPRGGPADPLDSRSHLRGTIQSPSEVLLVKILLPRPVASESLGGGTQD